MAPTTSPNVNAAMEGLPQLVPVPSSACTTFNTPRVASWYATVGMPLTMAAAALTPTLLPLPLSSTMGVVGHCVPSALVAIDRYSPPATAS